MKRRKDFFSKGIVIYAACFFLVYRILFQLFYVREYANLWYWAVGLIVVHIVGLIWCLATCLLCLMPRQFLSFACAASLVVVLEFLYPDPMKVHFWLHKSEYAARVSAAHATADSRLPIVLYAHATYFPGMAGGYLCATEILYDNSGDPDLISRSEDGRASFQRIDDNFYLRYPPCG